LLTGSQLIVGGGGDAAVAGAAVVVVGGGGGAPCGEGDDAAAAGADTAATATASIGEASAAAVDGTARLSPEEIIFFPFPFPADSVKKKVPPRAAKERNPSLLRVEKVGGLLDRHDHGESCGSARDYFGITLNGISTY
jgi:hypothetical protein